MTNPLWFLGNVTQEHQPSLQVGFIFCFSSVESYWTQEFFKACSISTEKHRKLFLILIWCLLSNLNDWHLPLSFGLHDIRAFSSQLLQSLSDNSFLLIPILLKQLTRCLMVIMQTLSKEIIQKDFPNTFLPVVGLV